MSSLTLQFDVESLREATAQAMLGVLTAEVKEKILEQAVRELLKPSTDGWNKNKSPHSALVVRVEIAFNKALEQLAQNEAKRMIKSDAEIRDRVQSLMRTTADKVLGADQEKLAQRMADAFVSSMRRD